MRATPKTNQAVSLLIFRSLWGKACGIVLIGFGKEIKIAVKHFVKERISLPDREEFIRFLKKEAMEIRAKQHGSVLVSQTKRKNSSLFLVSPVKKANRVFEELERVAHKWGPSRNNGRCWKRRCRHSYLRCIGIVNPDLIASAGGVIEGIGASVMGLLPSERIKLVDRLGETALKILQEAKDSGRTSLEIAQERAIERIARQRSSAGE